MTSVTAVNKPTAVNLCRMRTHASLATGTPNEVAFGYPALSGQPRAHSKNDEAFINTHISEFRVHGQVNGGSGVHQSA